MCLLNTCICTDPRGAEPVPDAPLLYVFPNNTFPSDSPNGASFFNGSSVGNNATIRFEKGKTYRLRFINMSGMSLHPYPYIPHSIHSATLFSTGNVPFRH